MMKEAIPASLVARAMKYAPLLKRLEARGARVLDREAGIIRNARRIEARRAEDEELRSITFLRRRREALALHRARQQKPIPAVSMTRRLELGEDVANSQMVLPSLAELLEEPDGSIEAVPSEPSRKAKKVQAALVRPDPFTVAAASYRETTSARVVCRKCDHTLTRGVRGVHLFSWNDNYHIALNEELADTISFKEISDPNEMQKSLWKRAKVACPCCGTSVGTLGVAHARMKVMFKGVCIAWRSTQDVVSHTKPPVFSEGKLQFTPHIHSTRPVGSSLPSTWLLGNAGLMTHNRRWVLDSTVMNQVVEQLNPSSKTSPISDAEPSPGSVVRASEKEPPSLTPLMKRLALRAMAVENIMLLDLNTNVKTVMEVLGNFEQLFTNEEGKQKPKAEAKAASEVNGAMEAEEAVPVEDSKEEAYELDRNSSLAFVRFACLDKLAQMKNTSTSAKLASALKTSKVATLRAQCVKYLKHGGTPVSFLSARVLCSGARLLTDDKEALSSLVNLLAERKQSYGPAAGVFGRSAEYLKSALESSQLFSEEEIVQAMERCSSLHPSPGGRFGVEYEPSGFAELFCTHGNGLDCDRRATHAAPPPMIAGVPPNMRDPKVRIPTMCRQHAPIGYLATAEGYRGVIPPYEDPMRNKPGPLQVVSSGYGQDRGFSKGGWYGRRNNRMVDVPDPNETTFSPPEPGTLSLGTNWEQNIKVCYTKDELTEVVSYFENHLAKAEELTKANGGVPSISMAIGLDVEWKPEFVFSEDNNICSIIQIATRERAFIFDAIALGAELSPLMTKLFRSKDIIKLGHGLGEDLARVAQSLSKSANNPDHVREYFPVESVMELAPLFAKAESRVFAYGTMPSLVSMVEAGTGLKLDKRCQMTDWERRPLSPAQIRYAATDAACGFLLLDHFAKKIQMMTNQAELDVKPFLQTDRGTTLPQRAGMPFGASATTTAVSIVPGSLDLGGTGIPVPIVAAPMASASFSPLSPEYMPPSSVIGPSPSMAPTPMVPGMMLPPPRAQMQPQGYYMYPPQHAAPQHYAHHSPYHMHHPQPHHPYQHSPRVGYSGRAASGARLSAVPRASNRKLLSKQEWRRVRELQNDLISQGVRVDQHAKLEGLEVATEHLQKSLNKVVRDSLVDPTPAASQPPSAPHSGPSSSPPHRQS